jgi:UDP-N-acetylglucosamine--N-acetylmuramyl-(pentapeptide) pyrophosphoryl-undecaprenol N-acetylglucosamine transferase
LEARILPGKGLDYLLVPVRGLRRGAVLENLGVVLDLLRALYRVGEAFLRLRPSLVVVTGGYAGGPAGFMAGLMGIPLALQEQNAQPGVTTRILSRWSRQIHLAFPEALNRLPSRARGRARISGNPIRVPAGRNPPEARARFGLDGGARVVLVVGGSQGSAAMNRAVLVLVREIASGARELPGDVQILWATGPAHLDEISGKLEDLGDPPWLRVLGYIDDMPTALDAATVAVSRSGAMTTSELLAWGVPAILVPLPTAAEDHQARNAESLANAGAAIHLPQDQLSAGKLWQVLEGLFSEPEKVEAMGTAARNRSRPEATREITEALASLLPAGRRGAA